MTHDEDAVLWYVVGTTGVHQELKIRDALRKEGIQCYVPMSYEARRVRGQVQRRARPAVTGLVFAHTSVKQFLLYVQDTGSRLFLRKSAWSRHQDYMVVNDRQMELFMQLTTAYAEDVTYYKPDEITLHEGELVEIMLGSQTYQAQIKRLPGKRSRQLIVEIPDVTTATITLTPDLLKLIKRLPGAGDEARRQQREALRSRRLQETGRIDERRSRNLEIDKRALFATAYRLLFVIQDEYKDELEYHLAMQELRRLRERLLTFRGMTAAQEGDLALALYLANVKLGVDVDASADRLRAVIPRLQTTSLLRLRLRYYLARLTNDAATLQSIQSEVRTWNKLTLSPRQKSFLQETNI